MICENAFCRDCKVKCEDCEELNNPICHVCSKLFCIVCDMLKYRKCDNCSKIVSTYFVNNVIMIRMRLVLSVALVALFIIPIVKLNATNVLNIIVQNVKRVSS